MQCGASLAASPAPYTPEHLLEGVLTTRSAREGERKQVTVLFVDIKGSLALSARVGPDRWHEILEGFFRALGEQIHQQGGTINQYTGDGVMALFSAPIAHENHAERACRAALGTRQAMLRLNASLRSEHEIELQTRTGINSGEVVVGRIGDNLRMDYTAQGESVGLAARLESICEPGQILLSEHTTRLLPPGFVLSELGQVELKGAGLVRTFALLGLDDEASAVVAPRNPSVSPFLGRAAELEQLEGALTRAAHGAGQVIGVSGDAGVGKSRLCLELLAHCAALGIPGHATRCAAHEHNRPLSSLLPLLRSFFGVGEGGDHASARAKLRAEIVAGAVSEAEADELVALIWASLELGDAREAEPVIDPEARKRRLQQALIAAFARAPLTLLLVDDAHWIDPVSEDLLHVLVDGLRASQIVLVVNFRPEYTAPWMEAAHYQPLRLTPLAPSDVDSFLAYFAGRDGSLSELFALVHDRARGNPLFIEEILRSLVEAKLLEGGRGNYRLKHPQTQLSVPATIQSILAARIDRLGEEPKHLLQTAAVIGSEFAYDLLAAVAGLPDAPLRTALEALEQAEFVQAVVQAPAGRFAFRHPLLREVAYGALLLQQRRSLHLRIADALAEDAQRSRRGDAAIVAHHFEAAHDPIAAARYYRYAAKHIGSADADHAYAHLRKVQELSALRPTLDLANRYELTACVQLLNLGWRRGIDRASADRLFTRGLELCSSVGGEELRATLHAGYGRALSALEGADAYIAQAREARRIAQSTGELSLIASMNATYAQALFRGGQLEAGVAICDEALASTTAEPVQRSRGLDFSVSSWILLLRGYAQFLLGRLDRAERDLQACLSAADARGEIDLLVAPRMHMVDIRQFRGDASDVQRLAREALELAERFGNSLVRINAHTAQGIAHLLTGAATEAERAFRVALEIAYERSAGMEFAPRMHAQLAEALLVQGRAQEALHEAEAGMRAARGHKSRVGEAQALLGLVQVQLYEADAAVLEPITHSLARAQELAEATGARLLLPQIALARAGCARIAGDEAEQSVALSQAERLLREMGAPARADAVRAIRHRIAGSPDRLTPIR